MTVPTLRTVELLTPEAFNSYLQTLLDTCTDDSGDKLSDYYEPYLIDETGLELEWEECYQFVKNNSESISQLLEDGHELETILHDFCLTRNREGAGFWEDSDYPHEIGQQLTASAHSFNPVSIDIGDDGGLYVFCG